MTDIPDKAKQAVKNRERDMYKKGLVEGEGLRRRGETQVYIRKQKRNKRLNKHGRRQPTRPTTGKSGFGDMESSNDVKSTTATGKRGFGDMESSNDVDMESSNDVVMGLSNDHDPNTGKSPTKRLKKSGKETEIRECIDLRLKQMEATRSASSSPSAPSFNFPRQGGKRKSRKRKSRKRNKRVKRRKKTRKRRR